MALPVRHVADQAAQLNFEYLDAAVSAGGPIGPEGPAGADGANGADGADGVNGVDGAPGEKWFTGAGGPAGTLTGSIIGDWYLNSTNGDYYEKVGTVTWTIRGNLKGPTGATGPSGTFPGKYGRVNLNGTIGASGSGGWGVGRSSAGVYVVTFSPALTSVPAVVVSPSSVGGATVNSARASSITVNGFTCETITTAAQVDSDWSFVAPI